MGNIVRSNIDELERALRSDKFSLSDHEIEVLTTLIYGIVEITVPKKTINAITRPPPTIVFSNARWKGGAQSSSVATVATCSRSNATTMWKLSRRVSFLIASTMRGQRGKADTGYADGVIARVRPGAGIAISQ